MSKRKKDTGLERLLDLNEQVFVIKDHPKHWVKFKVNKIKPISEKPHGIDYSITLHGAEGTRLLGFDNSAHKSKTKKDKKETNDHMHRKNRTYKYDFETAEKLMEDFWREVEKMLDMKG